MRSLIIALSVLMATMGLNANPVNSELKEVTVFLQGAQLHRTAQASIPAGIHEVIITGLPVQLDANSIQVKGQGRFTILSVSHRVNFLESAQQTVAVKILEDSLRHYKQEIDLLQALLKVYEAEETMLLANKEVGSKEKGVTVSDLRSIADFMRSRMTEVKRLALDTQQKLTKTQERHHRLSRQLSGLVSAGRQAVGELVITTSASASTRGSFDFSFITPQAAWVPVYDLRADDPAQPVQLTMKANVSQTTGEDWKNIRLKLSTGMPAQGADMPRMNPWYLQFLMPPPPAVKMRSLQQHPEMARTNQEVILADELMEYEMVAMGVMDRVSMVEGRTTVTYAIDTPYQVLSGSQPQLVEIQQYALPATYEYYAIPRLDTDVFLVARIPGWDEYVRLPGEASLFFEGTFVGKTFIDPAITGDTLEVGLGRDRGIVAERIRRRDFSRRSMLGGRTTETVAWELNLRNTKHQNVVVHLYDQVPLATDKDMEIKLEERNGARFDAQTGYLHWKLTLNPAESRKMSFTYSVRYPSSRKLVLE